MNARWSRWDARLATEPAGAACGRLPPPLDAPAVSGSLCVRRSRVSGRDAARLPPRKPAPAPEHYVTRRRSIPDSIDFRCRKRLRVACDWQVLATGVWQHFAVHFILTSPFRHRSTQRESSSMPNRPIRYRGTEYPVIERFRIGGRTVSCRGQNRLRPDDVHFKCSTQVRSRCGHSTSCRIQPATLDRVRTLQRLTRGDNEILQILECQREGESVHVVLPWIDGFNLRSVLDGIRNRKRQRIAAPEAVRLVKGVAHALRHLHRNKQIIHGDIKPANLILTNRTSLVLIDYGNAWTIERTSRREEGDGVSGVYSAPEFLRGEPCVDLRADCFSLGVVLYEILTEQIPYDGHGGKVGMLARPRQVRVETGSSQ